MIEPPPETVCRAWSVAQVEHFFQSCSLPQYVEAVRENCVDGQVFAELVRLNGLCDLGCESKLHQAKILARLRSLSSELLPVPGCVSPQPPRTAQADAAGADAAGGSACALTASRHGLGEEDLQRPELIRFLKDVVDVLEKSADAPQDLEEFLQKSSSASLGLRDAQRRALVAAIVSGLSDRCRQFTPDASPIATGRDMFPTFEEFVQLSNSIDSVRKADSEARVALCREICSQIGLRVTAGASIRRTSDNSGPETAVLCVENQSSRNIAVRAVTSSLMSYIIAPANYTLLPGEAREVYITPVLRHICEPYSLTLEVASVHGEDVLEAERWSELHTSSIDRLVLHLARGSIELMEHSLLNSSESAGGRQLDQPLISSKSIPVLNVNTSHSQTAQSMDARFVPSGRDASLGAGLAENLCSPTAKQPRLPQKPLLDSTSRCPSFHPSTSGVAPASLQAKLGAGGFASRGVLGGSVGAPVASPVRQAGAHSYNGSLGAPVGGLRREPSNGSLCAPVSSARGQPMTRSCSVGGSLRAPPSGPAKPPGVALTSSVPDWRRQLGGVQSGSPVAKLSAANGMPGFVSAGSISAASWRAPSGQRQIVQAVAIGDVARARSVEQVPMSARPLRTAR